MANKSSTKKASDEGIAIVGMACWYPGARNPRELWEVVLGRRREFRRMPDKRTPLSDYFDPDPAVPDKFYQPNVGVLDGFAFDWARFRIPRGTFECTDIAQWLCLEVASRALDDGKFTKDNLPLDRTGVFVGNTDTGEQMRSNGMRLRWPFIKRTLSNAAARRGMQGPELEALLAEYEPIYKSVLPPITEDFGAGSIGATIAGRVCNYFDFHGGAYVVDGACASSLVAVHNACEMLDRGNLDLALAGGVDISLDPFELAAFSKAGALSKTEMTPYDVRADGFVGGEGCGFVVLKKLSAAVKDGNEILAVIRGWGMSSDGRGGIMQPTARGQSLCIQRSLMRANVDPTALHFIEGHGTGTRVGDRAELDGLSATLQQNEGWTDRSCGIGSIKSVIGHTKAAAGVASLIKVACAVNRRVLPPSALLDQPNPAFENNAKALFPLRNGEILDPSTSVMGGVSSFGFGGINVHLTVASGDSPSSRLAPQMEERKLLVSGQDSEIFVFSSASIAELTSQLEPLLSIAQRLSSGDMTDLAASMSARLDSAGALRAAIIASTPSELADRLAILKNTLSNSPPDRGQVSAVAEENVVIGWSASIPKIGFLFPGQGSQHLQMARIIVERFVWARDLVNLADRWVEASGGKPISPLMYRKVDRAKGPGELEEWTRQLADTTVAQPAICLASLLCARFLSHLNIYPAAVGGHSLGELTAFHFAGAFDEEELMRLATVRGLAMAASVGCRGAMASLACSSDEAKVFIHGLSERIVISSFNAPRQVVVSGETEAVQRALALAVEAGVMARMLPVSNAFHSSFVGPAAKQVGNFAFSKGKMGTAKIPLFSSVEGESLKAMASPTGLHLSEHFSRQITSPVDFVRMLESMAEKVDLFLEVGPGRVLSGLARDTLNSGPRCYSVASKPDSVRDLLSAVGAAFVRGTDIKWEYLYEGRLVRPYTSPADRLFIENPLERSLPVEGKAIYPSRPSAAENIPLDDWDLGKLTGITPEVLTRYLQRRGPFLAALIKADLDSEFSASNPILKSEKHALESGQVSPEERGQLRPTRPVETIIIEIIAKKTGYAPATISSHSRLLDDLNIDSIKSGEIVAAVARELGASNGFDASRYANASIKEICDAISAATPLKLSAVNEVASRPETETQSLSVDATLLELVSNRTGYPKNTIRLDSRVLDDLNIDSIKAGELVGALLKEFGAVGKLDSSRFANSTLREIAAAVQAVRGSVNLHAEDISKKLSSTEVVIRELAELTGFPIGSIAKDAHLVKELNLDAHKLQVLVRRCTGALGIEQQPDLQPLQDRTVSQFAAMLASMGRHQESLASNKGQFDALNEPTWVHTFAFELQPEPFREPNSLNLRTEDKWNEANVLIVSDEPEWDHLLALKRKLTALGAATSVASYSEVRLKGLGRDPQISHLFGFLPHAGAQNASANTYEQMFGRLLALSGLPPARQAPRRRSTLTLIQYGSGFFGGGDGVGDPECSGAVGFARSLHMERADLRIRVLDFSKSFSPNLMVEATISEVLTPQSFLAVGYDLSGVRRVPKVRLIEDNRYPARSMKWGSEDVILVTGGGKGITAECALGIARATGALVALVGSSSSPSDPHTRKSDRKSDLESTLARFQAEQLRHRYYSCDISDGDAVKKLVQRIQTELGPITGVVHGAANLWGSKVENVKLSTAMSEMAPKVIGAMNLCAALKEHPPKLFIGFTSISLITGTPGNTVYTFSTEALDLLLQRFASEHSETSIQSLAFGVWKDAGYVLRADNRAKLENIGKSGLIYAPMSSVEAVSRFVQIFQGDPQTRHALVTGRTAGFDVWNQVRPPSILPDGLRFVERVIFHEPGVEIIARAHLSIDKDLYLRDHVYKGMFVMPTVFAMEALSQAAVALSGYKAAQVQGFEEVEMPWPVIVDADSGLEIELRAQRISRTDDGLRIRVTMRTEQSAFSKDYVLGTVLISLRKQSEIKPLQLPDSALPIEPEKDLYGRHFFVGPLFQRMEKVWIAELDRSVSSAQHHPAADRGEEGFAEGLSGPLVTGDPFLRDTLLHTPLLTELKFFRFTLGVKKVEFYSPRVPTGPTRFCVANVRSRTDTDMIVELVLLSKDGEILERWIDYHVHVVEVFNQLPTIRELIEPAEMHRRDSRLLSEAVSQCARHLQVTVPTFDLVIDPGLKRKPRPARHVVETALAKRALSSMPGQDRNSTAITWTDTGCPQIVSDSLIKMGVSFSLDDPYCIAVCGTGTNQGCDLTSVVPRSLEEWKALLGLPRMGLIDDMVSHGEQRDRAGARVWAALEAARKYSGHLDITLRIEADAHPVQVFHAEANGNHFRVATIAVAVTRAPERMLGWAVASDRAGEVIETINTDSKLKSANLALNSIEIVADPELGSDVLRQHFQLTWRDCTALRGSVMHSNYVFWFKSLVDLMVGAETGRGFIDDIAAGRMGGVTRWTELRVYGDATAYDQIECRLWLTELSNTSAQWKGEFFKLGPDGQRTLLAMVNSEGISVAFDQAGALGRRTVPEKYVQAYQRFVQQKAGESPLVELHEIKGREKLPPGSASGAPLHSEVIGTSLVESDLMGNVNNGYHFSWQFHVRDLFLSHAYRQAVSSSRGSSEPSGPGLRSRSMRVDYLRECMPFDKIEVEMFVEALNDSSAFLRFDYWRLGAGGTREKIAVGTEEVVWARSSPSGLLIPTVWPAALFQAFQGEEQDRLLTISS